LPTQNAIEIRRRIMLAFEYAERDSWDNGKTEPVKFTIIGGGPTGVELAGVIRDMSTLILKREYRSIDPAACKVLLLEGSPRILARYPEELSRKAEEQLRKLGNGIVDVADSAMSLKLQVDFSVPDETRRVAQAAFPKGCACLRITDALGGLYQDKQFAALFPRRGRPAEAPGRLALVTVLHITEGFSDRQTADAVRSRVDWKYALGLELTDSGFDHSVLSEFRSRLVAGELELILLDSLLERVQALGLLKQRGKQRTDSTHVLAAVRTMNRLERARETLRAALNNLAVASPEWLKVVADRDWLKRYGRRIENFNLQKTDAGHVQLAATIGSDGKKLLRSIKASDVRLQLASLAPVLDFAK
jgi:transposase